jgi:glutathione synthase/RimK-type ligase-like ATP-grasp enzyme
MKIGIVSYKDKARYASSVPDEDEMLMQFLKEKDDEPFVLVWDDPSVVWMDYDVLIIKSTWDYFDDKIDLFYQWLDDIKSKGVKIFNPVDTIKWNADKKYLKDIEAKGLKIVPTEFILQGSLFSPDYYFDLFKTGKLILKPSVSGGAKNTITIEKNKKYNSEEIESWLKKEDYIIQPFIPEILKEGEWSFVFFGKEFSHHLLKVPKGNDFRVQHVYGGTIHVPELPVDLLKQAEKIVKQFADDCLYARVDGVNVKGELWLMELELIEPYLFFFTNEHSMENYYKELKKLI